MSAPSDDILAIILDAGSGGRLYPLTHYRTKSAIPFAGKYRLIDVPISNCINSGIYHIAVLTDLHSVSFSRHIAQTYPMDILHNGWIQILAAENTAQTKDILYNYNGAADAVRKQVREIVSTDAKCVLILPGDRVYQMDYIAMAKYHWEINADITVAMQPIEREEASHLLKSMTDRNISSYVERPKDPESQKRFISNDDPNRQVLGSIGIYMFKTQVLMELLRDFPGYNDFGGDIIPQAIDSHKVYGFDFDGYWENVGSIRSFYETNLAFTPPTPPFDFHDADAPLYTNTRFLPASSVENSQLKNVLLAEGCKIAHSEITHSIIGTRSKIASNSLIKDSIIMGADAYNRGGIGANCHIEGAILDKNVRIGNNVVIRPFPRGTDIDAVGWYVRDGVVVIPKDADIPSGRKIEP